MKLFIKLGVLVGVLCVCLQGMPTFADEQADLAIAKRAYEQKDYATALKLIQPLAKKGNAEAQYQLGMIYAIGEKGRFIFDGAHYQNPGKGVKQNYSKAIKWFKQAAENQHTAAQFNLGWMLFHGEGMKQNLAASSKWFKLAVVASKKNMESSYITDRAQHYLDELSMKGID